MAFNENSRVKIPTILHLVRLGFEYLSLKGQTWDETTNIFTDIFNKMEIPVKLTTGFQRKLTTGFQIKLTNDFQVKLTS